MNHSVSKNSLATTLLSNLTRIGGAEVAGSDLAQVSSAFKTATTKVGEFSFSEYLKTLPKQFLEFFKNVFSALIGKSKTMDVTGFFKGVANFWLAALGKENLFAYSMALTITTLMGFTIFVSYKRSEDKGKSEGNSISTYLQSLNVLAFVSIFMKFFVFGSLLYYGETDLKLKDSLSGLLNEEKTFFAMFFIDVLMISYIGGLNYQAIKNEQASNTEKKCFGLGDYAQSLLESGIVLLTLVLTSPLLYKLGNDSIRIPAAIVVVAIAFMLSRLAFKAFEKGEEPKEVNPLKTTFI